MTATTTNKKNTWETLSIGSDEANSGSPIGPIAIAGVKLTKENLEIIKNQKWYEDFLRFIKTQEKEKDIRQINKYSWEFSKILRKGEDYVRWCPEIKKYNKMFEKIKANEDKKELEMKCILHRWIGKFFKNDCKKCSLPHIIDRFWKIEIEEDNEKYSKFFDKAISNGEKKYLSIAIAEILSISFANWKLKEICKDRDFILSYNENHQLNKESFYDLIKKFNDFEKKEIMENCTKSDKLKRILEQS